MATYTYPSAAELMVIENDFLLPRLLEGRPCFDFFPTREMANHQLIWDVRDKSTGLQQIRGLNGQPPRVKRLGAKRYRMEPGVYGEFALIDEAEMSARAGLGVWGEPVSVNDLVGETQDYLVTREYDRIEKIIWDLIVAGTFSVFFLEGVVIQTDAYTTQTFTASPLWTTVATATPMKDMRSVAILGRGYSTDLGGRAKAYANRTTINTMLANTNAADIGGRLVQQGNNIVSVEMANQIFLANDTPSITSYDGGYYDDTGTFQLFIPNNKVVVVGNRPGNEPVGEYIFTRNANNPNSAPGGYYKLVDRTGENQSPPPQIEVHKGHNGGPVLYYPNACVVMTVG